MEQETISIIINAFKEERIDLVVTLPEEPTSPLTEEIRKDPSFTRITRRDPDYKGSPSGGED
jgi:hypothetical protein